MDINFAVPCLLGLEAPIAEELRNMEASDVRAENGRVLFSGDENILARANICSRFSERVLVLLGSFEAHSFEELFQGTRALPWEQWIGADDAFPVKGYSIDSDLFSVRDCQAIIKKAVVERLKQKYSIEWFEESGPVYQIQFSIMKNKVSLMLDTSGAGLHKRGYRRMVSKAPIEETLAAALIKLTPWNKSRILVDPFCGSGTFPIEAAMMGANIAPGMHREFQAQNWDNIVSPKLFARGFEEAESLVDTSVEMDIQGYDIDPQIVKAARENARRAGVDGLIHFQQRPVHHLSHPKKYGFVITNPPYGARLEEKEDLPALYRDMGKAFAGLDGWSEYVITAYEDAERYIGKKAAKNRKIYNGMMKTYFYMFPGPKPPRRKKMVQQEE